MTDLTNWKGCACPAPTRLEGRTVVLEAFDENKHGAALWDAIGGDESANKRIHYFPDAPYRDADHFASAYAAKQSEWHTMVIRTHGERIGEHVADDAVSHGENIAGDVVGMASYMRIRPQYGSVELGAVAHGMAMARSPMSTEAHYLLARHIFDDLGYRRYEWKLNNNNKPSHNTARRLGFTLEGVFRQDMVTHGYNRDTGWYSMLDSEWPSRKAALEGWLDPSNFDASGDQHKPLEIFKVSAA